MKGLPLPQNALVLVLLFKKIYILTATLRFLEGTDKLMMLYCAECLQSILEERCDGGRNILHALVSGCQPTSNKVVGIINIVSLSRSLSLVVCV